MDSPTILCPDRVARFPRPFLPRLRAEIGSALSDARRPLAVYALSRALTLVLAALVQLVHPFFAASKFLSAWDGGWYLAIIRDGYPAAVPEVGGRATESVHAFFPLFPLTVRAVSRILPVSDAVAGIGVSLVCGAVAVLLVFRLACAVADRETAERAAALFSLFPGSLVFSMVYAEALTIALAATCLLALVRQRWLLAGLAAALATATRPNAVALVGACAWAAAVAVRRRGDWRALTAPLLAPAGLLAFFAFLWVRTGDAGAWFRVQHEAWGQDPGAAVDLATTLVRSPFGDWNLTLVALSLVFAAVALVLLLLRRWPLALSVYTLLVLALSASSRLDGLRPRFVLTAFPLLIAVAEVARGKRYRVLVGTCAMGLVALTLLHNLFVLSEP